MALFIFCSIACGIITGYIFEGYEFIGQADSIVSFALALLLFLIGMELGSKRQYLEQIKNWGWRIIYLPLLAGAGSILFGIMAGFFLGLSWYEGAAVGSGFGWYSLSGVLIADIYSVKLGAVAFLSNVFREVLAFIFIPVLVQRFGGGSAVAIGGAASMDTLLPVIHKTSGGKYTLWGVISGIVLSMLVPLLVPFFLSFGL